MIGLQKQIEIIIHFNGELERERTTRSISILEEANSNLWSCRYINAASTINPNPKTWNFCSFGKMADMMVRASSGLAYPERFYAAASYVGLDGSQSSVKQLSSKFSNDTALLLYALHQQVRDFVFRWWSSSGGDLTRRFLVSKAFSSNSWKWRNLRACLISFSWPSFKILVFGLFQGVFFSFNNCASFSRLAKSIPVLWLDNRYEWWYNVGRLASGLCWYETVLYLEDDPIIIFIAMNLILLASIGI